MHRTKFNVELNILMNLRYILIKISILQHPCNFNDNMNNDDDNISIVTVILIIFLVNYFTKAARSLHVRLASLLSSTSSSRRISVMSLWINGELPSSITSSSVATLMQEHRSNEAKNADVTPPNSHVTTTSNLFGTTAALVVDGDLAAESFSTERSRRQLQKFMPHVGVFASFAIRLIESSRDERFLFCLEKIVGLCLLLFYFFEKRG